MVLEGIPELSERGWIRCNSGLFQGEDFKISKDDKTPYEDSTARVNCRGLRREEACRPDRRLG